MIFTKLTSLHSPPNSPKSTKIKPVKAARSAFILALTGFGFVDRIQAAGMEDAARPMPFRHEN